jgi:hypothetical protein
MNFQLSDPERDFLKNWLQNSRVERNDSVLKEAWFFIASLPPPPPPPLFFLFGGAELERYLRKSSMADHPHGMFQM